MKLSFGGTFWTDTEGAPPNQRGDTSLISAARRTRHVHGIGGPRPDYYAAAGMGIALSITVKGGKG